MNNWEDFWWFFLGALIILAITLGTTHSIVTSAWQKEAVAHKAAEFYTAPEGGVKWRWKE